MSPVRRLLPYVLKYRREFLIGLGCVVMTTGITLVSPLVLRYAIDDLTESVTRAKLAAYGGLLLTIGVVGGYFRFLMRRVLMGASRYIEYDMRNDFFAHLERLPVSYFQSHRTGDLMSRATNDLGAVRMMIGPSVMYSANTGLTFVIALPLMLSIDVRLTLLALVPLPFVSLSVKYFGGEIHRRFEEIQAQLADMSAVTQEALAGVRVVRAYRQEGAALERFRRSNLEYVARNRRLITLQGFFFPSMSLFLGLAALLVLWAGSREVIAGRITIGQFVAFNAYLTLLAWPMIAFGWVTNMLQRGMASWKRMLEVLDTEPAIADAVRLQADATSDQSSTSGIGVTSTDLSGVASGSAVTSMDLSDVASLFSRTYGIRGDIEFRDLVFAYDGRPVLNHVSVRIAAGERVAIVGPTGSGKSTLVSLLARLHDPPRGTVFIDGTDVRDLPLAVLRGAIGFVPQEPFLFSDTIADNVAFGLDARALVVRQAHHERSEYSARPELVEGRAQPDRYERVLNASVIARLDKDVAGFPKGYDTMVGERGITLSGGQKQRAAIARAMAIQPRILVLDDALSSVDTYTEEEILSRLATAIRNRTSIIVSHRISTVREADQILVLDEGRIAERGTHEQLIAHDGLYAELYRKQLLEEELAAS